MSDYKNGDTASWSTEQVRRQRSAQPKKRKRRRHNPLLSAVLYIIIVVLASAILAGVGWLLASDLCAFNKEPITATIEVTADDDMGSITGKLHDAGLINYKWFFRLFGAFANAEEKIGIFAVSTYNTDYILTRTERFSDALTALRRNGYTVKENPQ